MHIAYAIAGADTVTTSHVEEDGSFKLGFLETGTYDIIISDTLGLTYSAPGTSVIAGEETLLGDITLE